jgi:hypothetical protein
MVAPSMTRASNAPNDILMAQVLPRFRFETQSIRAHPTVSSSPIAVQHGRFRTPRKLFPSHAQLGPEI